MHELCKRRGYPDETTIYDWLQKFPEFSQKYLAAREMQADRLVNDLIPIADGERPTKDAEGQPLAPGVQVRRDGERIKVRMWQAGRMSPRRWGGDDGIDMGGGTITPPIVIIRRERLDTAGFDDDYDHRALDQHVGDAPKDAGKNGSGQADEVF